MRSQRTPPGAKRVPMHPWNDPANAHRPVTRAELMKAIATLDAGCAARHGMTWGAKVRRALLWLRARAKWGGGAP